MSAMRDGDRLVIRDFDGDEVSIRRGGTYAAVIDRFDATSLVALTTADALAAASFLAEAAGVELPTPGPCGHSLGTQCHGCDHAAHPDGPCEARSVTATGEGPCGCRFDGVPVADERALPARGVLTLDELDALPIGAVVDAAVTGVRVRAMRVRGGWSLTARLDGSSFAHARDLKDAALVTAAPIAPAPAPALPTEAGTVLSAVVTHGSEARRLVVIRSSGSAFPWFSGALVGGQFWHGDSHLSDWRVIDPESGAVTS